MEQPCLLRRNRFWRDGPNTLTVSSTAPLQSTTQPFNTFHKLVNLELDSPPTTEEVVKALKEMSTEKAPESDAIPANVFKAGGLACLTRSSTSFSPSCTKSDYLESLEKPQSSTSTSAKETGIPATVIAISLFSPFPARFQPACCSTASSNIWGKVSSLRASAASAQVKERST